MLDCSGCNQAVSDPNVIKNFNDELIKKIEMVPYGLPQIVRFGEGYLAGITLVQLIETSNICCHFCDDGTMYLDVFSCKPYNSSIVMELVKKYFSPKKEKILYITRNAD